MRYWVYKDSRIMGPMSSQELAHVEGGGPDLLLCPEGAEGSRESDWKTAGEIPELADVFPIKAATAVSVLEADVEDFDSWPLQGLSSEEIESMRHYPSWGPGPLDAPVRQRESMDAQRRTGE